MEVALKKFIMTKDIHNYHQLQILESLIVHVYVHVVGSNYVILFWYI